MGGEELKETEETDELVPKLAKEKSETDAETDAESRGPLEADERDPDLSFLGRDPLSSCRYRSPESVLSDISETSDSSSAPSPLGSNVRREINCSAADNSNHCAVEYHAHLMPGHSPSAVSFNVSSFMRRIDRRHTASPAYQLDSIIRRK